MKNVCYFVGNSQFLLANALKKIIDKKNLVILCIGTDKVTGDCLGPLCGDILTKKIRLPYFVYGNLDIPVNAKNIGEVELFIRKKHEGCKILAIDSALGSAENVGLIQFGKGSISAGAAIRKTKIEVGDYFITAIVNSGSIVDNSNLFSTRLKVVNDIANIICKALGEALGSENIADLTEAF